MANKKISELTAFTELATGDLFVVVDGSSTKKIVANNVKKTFRLDVPSIDLDSNTLDFQGPAFAASTDGQVFFLEEGGVATGSNNTLNEVFTASGQTFSADIELGDGSGIVVPSDVVAFVGEMGTGGFVAIDSRRIVMGNGVSNGEDLPGPNMYHKQIRYLGEAQFGAGLVDTYDDLSGIKLRGYGAHSFTFEGIDCFNGLSVAMSFPQTFTDNVRTSVFGAAGFETGAFGQNFPTGFAQSFSTTNIGLGSAGTAQIGFVDEVSQNSILNFQVHTLNTGNNPDGNGTLFQQPESFETTFFFGNGRNGSLQVSADSSWPGANADYIGTYTTGTIVEFKNTKFMQYNGPNGFVIEFDSGVFNLDNNELGIDEYTGFGLGDRSGVYALKSGAGGPWIFVCFGGLYDNYNSLPGQTVKCPLIGTAGSRTNAQAGWFNTLSGDASDENNPKFHGLDQPTGDLLPTKFNSSPNAPKTAQNISKFIYEFIPQF